MCPASVGFFAASTAENPTSVRCRTAASAIGVATAALGVMVLLGWTFRLQTTRGIDLIGGTLMKPNAAISFILCGLSLWLGVTSRLRSIHLGLAGLAVALGTATLGEWVFNVDLGIDELLFRDTTRAYTTVPGRIALNTALAFSLLGVALLLLRAKGIHLRIARALTLVSVAIGAIAFAGHLYGVSPLFAVARHTGMSFVTAMGLVVLSIGVLLARPDTGATALFASPGAGGVLARSFLPLSVLLPIALAVPSQVMVHFGLIDQSYAAALVTVGLTGALAWVVFRSVRLVEIRDAVQRETARQLAAREAEAQRRAAEIERLNAQLRHHTMELGAINRELESFSYSVSHDLRAPLRSIDGFAQALVEDCAAQLSPAGQEHLGRIRTAAQRMGRLIDDLLQLSRITRNEMRTQLVDLSTLAREAAAELAQGSPGRTVHFEIEDRLTAFGDPALLRILIDNLIGNAWKFTSKQASARIAVGSTQHEGKPAFFVRDDGAGFDMAYAGKLFGAFQRLHGTAEFPGSGIGLATAQRIVHRHGGEIWAEGAVAQGATFTFTLPIRAAIDERTI